MNYEASKALEQYRDAWRNRVVYIAEHGYDENVHDERVFQHTKYWGPKIRAQFGAELHRNACDASKEGWTG